MSRLAIIPARGGSKRIPRKNIKEFCGKPIIGYSIEAALSSKLFDEVMVSTDDEEIAEIARSFGASVPFMRSKETANDYAILKDVLNEVLAKFKELGKSFDEVCCILPTAPLIECEDILNAHEILSINDAVSVVPVVKYSYTIWRSLKIENSKLQMNWPENFPKRSQDLPDAYHDAGLFYWYSKRYFEEKIAGFGENACPYILEEEKVQDIDTEDDWRIAEMKFNIMKQKMRGGYGCIVKNQLNSFFDCNYDFEPYIPAVLSRLERCFGRIRNKYYHTEQILNPTHSCQWLAFLYTLSMKCISMVLIVKNVQKFTI